VANKDAGNSGATALSMGRRGGDVASRQQEGKAVDSQRSALMGQFWEYLNAGRYDALDRLIAKDYVDHFPQSGVTSPGREGVKEAFRLQHLGLARPHYAVESTLDDDDMVATRFTVSDGGAGAVGALGAFFPANLPFELHGLYLCRIADGRITEGGALFDDLPLLRLALDSVARSA
jgi:ketosteroid isomerase-like protein